MPRTSMYFHIYNCLRYLLPVIGILIGGAKIIGAEIEKHVFAGIGASDAFRIGFGGLQLFFGVLIAFFRTQWMATVVSMGLLVVAASLMAANGMFGFMLVPLFGCSVLVFFLRARKKALKLDRRAITRAKQPRG